MKKTIFIPLIFLLLAYSLASAQNDDFRSMVMKIKIEMLVEKLKLDKSEEDKFVQKYKDFNQLMMVVNKRRAAVTKQIETNLENNEALDTLIDRMLDIEQEITSKRKAFAEDLRTFLTPKQIVQLIIFEKNFALKLGKILKEFKGKRKQNR